VKERALGAAEMANALAVAFLLDGNVRKQGGNLRVGAELIDGRTGFSQWSATFERPMNEMVTVQDAIADAVTAELSLTRSAASADDKYGASKNAAAYNDYFKGEELYSAALSNETDLAALAHFDRAIERDPEFGAAHAARARSLTSLGNTSDDVVKARLYYESAQVAARRAVDFGPASADAHSTLGYVLFQALLRVADAKEPYQRSYELGRGNATVLARFAGYAASTRRFAEAEKAVLRARDLDPLNATIQRAVGFVLYASGRYEDANEAVRRALSLNPKLSDSHARIGMGLIALGQSAAAIEAAKNEKSGMVRYPCLAIAHHLTGDADAAKSAMAALIDAYGDAGLYQQAQVLAQWGDADNAMAVLKRAHELGDSGLTYLYIDPALDPVRGRPDFKVLLRALGYV
jgi:tetratricopeptide (TPR) repeat protein